MLPDNGESRYEPWGSYILGPGFPVGMSFPQILGIQLKVHSPAQDGVLLSRWSLFCLFPPSDAWYLVVLSYYNLGNSLLLSIYAIFSFFSVNTFVHFCLHFWVSPQGNFQKLNYWVKEINFFGGVLIHLIKYSPEICILIRVSHTAADNI